METIPVPDSLDDFEVEVFDAEGFERTVYVGGEGPAVIVMAEIPGITPEVARFARAVRDRGHTVAMPVLFGSPGAPVSGSYLVRSLARACVAREFSAFAVGSTAPITAWLTALARSLHQRCGGPGVGAVGMCFTGGFALAMAVDPSVVAPVMSQPSLPIGVRRSARSDVGLSSSDRSTIEQRVADGLCSVALRFTKDRAVPDERFRALEALLGDNFVGIELDSSKGNPGGNSRVAHSVLTNDLRMDDPSHETHIAFVKVLDFLDERLRG